CARVFCGCDDGYIDYW
nr:immunoglobulin heavy chain junction region [Mus musculus]